MKNKEEVITKIERLLKKNSFNSFWVIRAWRSQLTTLFWVLDIPISHVEGKDSLQKKLNKLKMGE